MPLGMEVGLHPSDIVLDGDPAPLPKKKAEHPQFSAHVYWDVYCGKTAAWIKMPLGVEVGLGLGHIVLDGDPTPLLHKGAQPLPFLAHVYFGQRAGWIKMPLGTKVGPGPCRIVLHGDIASPPKRGTASPEFSVHVYCDQTFAHLSYC